MSDKTEDEQCLASAPSKMRQWVKLSQIKEALVQSGFKTLDDQAAALGLSRSTAWSILRGKHKNSGLSSAVILRMLTRADLPPAVRQRLLEYIEDKVAGLYGDSPFRLRQFKERLGDARHYNQSMIKRWGLAQERILQRQPRRSR